MKLPIAKKINLIVVADHGMRKIYMEKQIVITDLIKKEWVQGIYGFNPVYTIRTIKGKEDKVYKKLKKNKHLNVYRRNKVPNRFNFGYNTRNNNIIVIAKPNYGVFATQDEVHEFGGAHGYLNRDKQMSALFIANGNAFKDDYTKRCIKNIDVYNLIAHILNIPPAPNDGKFRRVKTLLKR